MELEEKKALYPEIMPVEPSFDPPPPYSYAKSNSLIIGKELGAKPVELTCKKCNENIITKIELRVSTRTHSMAALCCVLGGLPLAWIPYCVGKCHSKDHHCPNCETYLGTGAEWPFI